MKISFIFLRVLSLSFLFLGLLFAEDNKEQSFWPDMPYDDKYLPSANYGDFMQKPSYDDVICLSLMGDDYVVAGTSYGIVVWNIKESTYKIQALTADWTPEGVEKEYFSQGNSPQPRTETGKRYFDSWTRNAVKNIYVLADGSIWADTFNGSAILKDNVLQNIFKSDEEAIAAQYKTVVMNKTIWKEWLVSKNENIFWRHDHKKSLGWREIGRQFDGKQWQSVFVDDTMKTMLYDWYLDRDGIVWAKVWPDLFRFDGSQWSKILSAGPIAFYQAINGTVWVGFMNGVAEFSNKTCKYYENPGYTSGIIETKEGKLWFFGENSATSWDGKDWKKVSFVAPYNNLGISNVFCSADNRIWLYDRSDGLLKFDGEQINSVPEGRGINIKEYLQASNGDIWLTLWNGLAVIKGNKVDMLKGKEMLGKYLCRQIVEGKDGSIWVASQEGLWQLKDGNWKHFIISKATPKAPESIFDQYMQNLVVRASFGNCDKIKGMKEQELCDYLKNGSFNSPIEFVVAYLRLRKLNEKAAIESCSEGIQYILSGKMKGFSSPEAQMWLGLCGRDLIPPLVKMLETAKDEQICFMGANYIPTCLTKEDIGTIANLFQHKNLQSSLRARLALAESLLYNKDIRGIEYLIAILKEEGDDSARIREDAFITLSLLASISNDIPAKSSYELWTAWLKKNHDTIKLSEINLGEREEHIMLFKKLSKAFMDMCYQKAE
ncbi:MAG: hypothetical protein V1701_00340 [Planctomycetota bacterium]